MSSISSDFFESNDQALRKPKIILRDSLGFLAVQLLSSREDISNMDYPTMLFKLHEIITNLHDTYDEMCHELTE